MLNLDKIIAETEKDLAKLPPKHKAFVLGMHNKIKESIRLGKPTTGLIKEIENYVSKQ